MKYSIIIPVYNAAKTLNRCVSSITGQSFGDYEIILADDGSTDGSDGICDELAGADERIIVIHKANGGASSARNAGLDIARGDYILFVDSDDYVEDCFFDVLDGCEIKRGLAVFTNDTDDGSSVWKREIRDMGVEFTLYEKAKYLIESRTINGPYTKIFDRTLIEEHGLRFNERVMVAEDFLFCTKYLLRCSDVQIRNIGIYMNDQTSTDSLSRGRKEGLIDMYPIVFDEVFDEITACRFSEGERRELYSIWDKLHTDSLVTCVLEEIKGDGRHADKIRRIRCLCRAFYEKYNETYGYRGLVHFAVRFCIRHKCACTLYILSRIYMRMR